MRVSVDQLLQDLFEDSEDSAEPNVVDVNGPIEFFGFGTAPATTIPGLALLKGFLTDSEQVAFLHEIECEGWFDEVGANQAMRFGDLPSWATRLAARVPTHSFPAEVASRTPMFDQIIVNLYYPGDGISPHIDLLRFEDGIAIYSFGDPAVMHLTREQQHCQVLLEGGDLLLLCGEARYEWRHGILPVEEEEHEGGTIRRGKRVSVTMRKLCSGIVLCHQ